MSRRLEISIGTAAFMIGLASFVRNMYQTVNKLWLCCLRLKLLFKREKYDVDMDILCHLVTLCLCGVFLKIKTFSEKCPEKRASCWTAL